MPEFRAMLIDNRIKPLQGYEEEWSKITPDTVINVKVSNPRSKPHLGLFFAAIKSAYDNWPEDHEQQFTNPDHMRQWLEAKAGWGKCIELSMDQVQQKGFSNVLTGVVNSAIGSVKGKSRRYVFITNSVTKLWVIYAESISYETMSQDEFNTVSQRISDLLKEHTGVSLEEFKLQGRAA